MHGQQNIKKKCKSETVNLILIHVFLFIFFLPYLLKLRKGKSKAVPLQAWKGPEGSRKLRLPDFVTTAQDGGRLSALPIGHLYPVGNTPGTHLC